MSKETIIEKINATLARIGARQDQPKYAEVKPLEFVTPACKHPPGQTCNECLEISWEE